MGSIWGRYGIDLGSIRGRFRVDLGSVWGRFGIDLGSAWDRFGGGSGTIWDRVDEIGRILGQICRNFVSKGIVSKGGPIYGDCARGGKPTEAGVLRSKADGLLGRPETVW